MDRKQIAHDLIKNIGGIENITQSWHCITRLRFNCHDNNIINLEAINALDGVMGAQFQSGQFQVIIGQEVLNIYAEVSQLMGKTATAVKKGRNRNIIEAILDTISGIFTPLLPAITSAGLLKGVMALLVSMQLLPEGSSTYEVLNFIADAPFHFLPFLVAFSAARHFNTDTSLSVTLAGILMYPTLMEYAASGDVASLRFLGMGIPMNSYASSVLPVILGVWLLSYVYNIIKKQVPLSLTIIFAPLLTLIVVAPLMLIFIAPLGSYIGTYLNAFFTMVFTVAGPIAGMLMGGIMPLIVMTGMHYAFFPGSFVSFEKVGYDIMLIPMSLVANLAQAGAVFAVFIKTKDKEMKQLSLSAFMPALFGITEPAIYGVNMKLKKPFYASLVGGAVGGGIFGLFTVKSFAFTIPGITSLPTYVEKGTDNFLLAMLGVSASFALSFLLTLLLKFERNATPVETTSDVAESAESPVAQRRSLDILSPLTGHVKPLESVSDTTFAEGLIGKGVAVIPTEGTISSPFYGKVTMLTPTNHAIGLVSADGVELLIHIGLETVTLKGSYFTLQVAEGQAVSPGEVLITFDLTGLRREGINLISPVIITNSSHYLDVIYTSAQETVAAKDKLLTLIK